MLHQKQHKSTFTIGALLIGTVALAIWSLDAHGMGSQKRIEGRLVDLPDFGVPDGVLAPRPSIGRCVLRGIELTGKGVDAISYQSSTLTCEMYQRVDDVINAGGWCSQWVFPNAIDHCLPQPRPEKVSWRPYFEFLGCHACSCSDYDIGFSASGASSYEMEYSMNGQNWSFSQNTTATDALVHGSNTLVYWRVRGWNGSGPGEWSVTRTTRAQCDCGSGGGGPGGGGTEPP